jgi:hypothetical protein
MFLSPEELTIFFVETPTEIIGYTNNFLIWKNPTDFFSFYISNSVGIVHIRKLNKNHLSP